MKITRSTEWFNNKLKSPRGKKLNKYSLSTKIRDYQAEILSELESFGLKFTDYSKSETVESDDEALENILDIIVILEDINRFLRDNLSRAYQKNPLLIQKELLKFTLKLTDHREPLELIYSLIGQEFRKEQEEAQNIKEDMTEKEILQILINASILRHLGRMHHEDLGIPEKNDKPDILLMLKHKVPLFLVLKNPLRAALDWKNSNGTFSIMAEQLGAKPRQSIDPLTTWLKESKILNPNRRETLNANAEISYKEFLKNLEDTLEAKQQKKTEKPKSIGIKDNGWETLRKSLRKITDTSPLLDLRNSIPSASLSLSQSI